MTTANKRTSKSQNETEQGQAFDVEPLQPTRILAQDQVGGESNKLGIYKLADTVKTPV